MRKIIILLIALIICSAITIAAYSNVEYLGDSRDYKIRYTQAIHKGWNLLPADMGSWSLTSDLPEEEVLAKIKAYYVYLPIHNQYADAMGGFNSEEFAMVQSNREYMKSSAAWYYVSEPITLSFIAEDGGGFPKLYKGWNFVAIGPTMTVYNSNIKLSNKFPIGDCEITKGYYWDSLEQKWESIAEAGSLQNSLDEISDEEATGAGMIIKVTDSCQLGVEGPPSLGPPNLPN